MTKAIERIPTVPVDHPDAPYGAALTGFAAHELVFAVVGPVGSGTSEISGALDNLLSQQGFDSTILKARRIIEDDPNVNPILGNSYFERSKALQDAGDHLRKTSGDNAIIAVGFVERIRAIRAKKLGADLAPNVPIEPDGTDRAYILDSIRHPHEVELLRRVYQDAFCLIGIFCQDDERLNRLSEKFPVKAGRDEIKDFMERDENAPEAYGQKVSEAFHLSDYFIDNTITRLRSTAGRKESNPEWDVSDQLGRLVDILTHRGIIRPHPNEIGMFHAYGARMRSSCLSRQVGAALLDRSGTLIATGTNEVPKAGGGVYGGNLPVGQSGSPEPKGDFRCFMHNGFCTNTREQNKIVDELMESVRSVFSEDDSKLAALREQIRSSRVGQLLEFSRSVHAEMDALLSAGRNGIPTVGTRLFVTTFPCHSCARHIVSSGIEEVQYIEPYLKSQAIPLHGDAIVTNKREWRSPAMESLNNESPNVLFRPFIGVAPRLYRRAFLERQPLKDPRTGTMLGALNSTGRTASETLRVSYPQIEAHLASLKASESS